MHSGLLILLWLTAVASLQGLPPAALLVAVAAVVLLALWYAPGRVRRLVRRVRILLLVIAGLFAWFTPGEAVLVDLPALSPSREGLQLALVHALHLLGVVCGVAVLLEHLSVERLVGGLYALSRPFSLIGLSSERLAVRMLLVLRHVEARELPGWRTWLNEAEVDAAPDERLVLRRETMRPVEYLLLVALSCALLLWGVW